VLANVFAFQQILLVCLATKILGFFSSVNSTNLFIFFGKIHQIFNITNLEKKKKKTLASWLLVVWQVNLLPLSSFILELIWVFFKLLGLGLHDKFNWIMLIWREVSITWPIELILNLHCLNSTWFVSWKTCSNPYVPTSRKVSKGTCNLAILLTSFKLGAINCWTMSKQGGLWL